MKKRKTKQLQAQLKLEPERHDTWSRFRPAVMKDRKKYDRKQGKALLRRELAEA